MQLSRGGATPNRLRADLCYLHRKSWPRPLGYKRAPSLGRGMTSPNCPVCFTARPPAGTPCPACGHTYAAPVSLSKNDDAQVLRTVSLLKQPEAATGPSPSFPPMATSQERPLRPSATWGQQRAPQPQPARSEPPRSPTLPAGPGVPPRGPATGPSRTRPDGKLLAIAVGIVVAATLIVIVIVAVSRSDNNSHQTIATANTNAAAPRAAGSTSPDQTSAPSSQPATTNSTPSIPAPLKPALPVTASNINFSQVAGAAELRQVAAVLDTYFSGINEHNGRKAAGVFASNGSINPHDPKQVAAFTHGISTTHDDEIAVESIRPASFGGEPGLAVRLRFRSRQEASLGPHDETCTDWSLTQKLVAAVNRYKLLGSERVVENAC